YPDSSQVATLFALTDTCNNLPSAYARNMLMHFGLITYDEPVYFPLALSSSVTWQNPFTEIDFPKSSSLSLFPNPADDYFIIEYAIAHSYEQAVIVIHNMNGKLVRNFYIKGKQNQVVIPTGDLNNGVYIVSLYINNKLEDSKKITLLK
ncbi:MAG: T9SS type A sorting domain-containing protein, partial [Bacteroidales bacterium]|nr:T9SS type A sorting domain-containing protein [Bacteroidales bacterium]